MSSSHKPGTGFTPWYFEASAHPLFPWFLVIKVLTECDSFIYLIFTAQKSIPYFTLSSNNFFIHLVLASNTLFYIHVFNTDKSFSHLCIKCDHYLYLYKFYISSWDVLYYCVTTFILEIETTHLCIYVSYMHIYKVYKYQDQNRIVYQLFYQRGLLHL